MRNKLVEKLDKFCQLSEYDYVCKYNPHVTLLLDTDISVSHDVSREFGKIMKFLPYISHDYTLALTDQKLFSDSVEAWKYGPVIPNIYQEFKHYGGGEITKLKLVELL